MPPGEASYSLKTAITERQDNLVTACNLAPTEGIADFASIERTRVRVLLGNPWFDDEETETYARIQADREAARKVERQAAREAAARAVRRVRDRLDEIAASLLDVPIPASVPSRSGSSCVTGPCWSGVVGPLAHNLGKMSDGKSVLVLVDAKRLNHREIVAFRRGDFSVKCKNATVLYSEDFYKSHRVSLTNCTKHYSEAP